MVALAMALVVVACDLLFGRPVALQAATGALCASIVDQPGPLPIKWRVFLLEVAAATVITVIAAVAEGSPFLLGPLVAVMSAATAMVSAFGRRALGLGVAAVLALLFGMATPVADIGAQFSHALVFGCGGLAYGAIAMLLAWALDDRTRQLYLGEAMLSFARYIAAKAELYDTHIKPRPALQALVEAHADLVERLQAARDMIFSGRRTPARERWITGLITLLDCFDTMLSSDADIETLRSSQHRHLMRRLHSLSREFAQDVQILAIGFVTPAVRARLTDRDAQLQSIAEEVTRLCRAIPEGQSEPADISAFRATQRKFAQTALRLKRLAAALDTDIAPPPLPAGIDLRPFMQVESVSWKILRAQLTLESPVLRYAIRLTLAMTSGYLLTRLFPVYVHGGWVMLTTALIMRANYSVTRRRRDDRVIGNLAGCIASVLLIRYLPPDAQAATVILAVAVGHAYGAVNYRVTAFAACISALLQLHFLAPLAHPLLFERMLDTLLGAGLAWAFSYVLPSWEWRNVPKLIHTLVTADRDYAAQALVRDPVEQTLRLARKRAHDTAANLSNAVRRLVDEPGEDRRALVALNELLAANYLLTSDLASMRVLFRQRAQELEPVATEELLSASRRVVAEGFDDSITPPTPDSMSRRSLSDLGGANAAISLKRRLVHIERAAERVAALAGRALREAT